MLKNAWRSFVGVADFGMVHRWPGVSRRELIAAGLACLCNNPAPAGGGPPFHRGCRGSVEIPLREPGLGMSCLVLSVAARRWRICFSGVVEGCLAEGSL